MSWWFKRFQTSSPPSFTRFPFGMSPLINQSEIPTLPLLYNEKKLSISPQPIFTSSATLNAKIALIRADITKLHLPNGAIVNAANESLAAGGGVCGAIHAAAGRELAEVCDQLHGCATGYAKMTKAFRLPCKRIIHAVGPIYWKARRGNEHSALLASCYAETLKLCVQEGLTAVAFCALSTGVYGYPSYEAAETAMQAVREFLETEDGGNMELVVFCNFEKKDEIAYHDLISKFFPPPELEEGAGETTEDARDAEASKSTEAIKPTETTDGAADAEPNESQPIEPGILDKISITDSLTKNPKEEGAPSTNEPGPVAPGEPDDADEFILIDKEDVEK